MSKPTEAQTLALNERLNEIERAYNTAKLYSNQARCSMASSERRFIASWLFGRAVCSVFLSFDSEQLSCSVSKKLAEIADASHSDVCNICVKPYVFTDADSTSCPCNTFDLDDVDIYPCLLQDLADAEDDNEEAKKPLACLADSLLPVADLLVSIAECERDLQAQATARRIRALLMA